jgi:hypothetical protein
MKTKTSPEDTPIEKRYWTVKDGARYLNVHYTTLYDWINIEGKRRITILIDSPPPTRRFGGTGRNCIRLPIEEFKKWADKFK